jgi:hypothetical protein
VDSWSVGSGVRIEKSAGKNAGCPPAVTDHGCVNLIPGNVGQLHCFKDVDVVNISRRDVTVIASDSAIHKTVTAVKPYPQSKFVRRFI